MIGTLRFLSRGQVLKSFTFLEIQRCSRTRTILAGIEGFVQNNILGARLNGPSIPLAGVPFSVSVWHLTSSAPFHRLLFSAGAVKASRFESLRRPAWAQITALPQALCSPDGCHVSLLDSSKSLQVLNLGPEGKGPVSLVPIGAGNEDEETALSERQKAGESASPQRSGSERNAVSGGSEESANVHDVAWWSNDALLVSRADGAVTVGKLPGLVNMLGESAEKFGPSPRVTGVVRKRAFVLDGVEEEKEAEGERTEEGLPQGATTARQVSIKKDVTLFLSGQDPCGDVVTVKDSKQPYGLVIPRTTHGKGWPSP